MSYITKIRKRSALHILILIETIVFSILIFGILNISYGNTTERRSDLIRSTLSEVNMSEFNDILACSYKEVQESIIEKRNETVWTTENVNYRKGPDENYKKVGILDKYAEAKRTGITQNGWSRIIINGKKYYAKNDYLTNETPFSAAISPGQKGEYQKYALSILEDYGWKKSEIDPLIKLWNRESGWNPASHNKYSGAHGIAQALPASKMASEGSDYMTNGKTQIRWGLGYIKSRYGSPSKAWAHFCSVNWY